MKDEADKVTIDEFNEDHNPALHAEAAAKGLTPWQLFSNRMWATKALATGGHYQAVLPQKVTGRRFNGSKTPDNVRPNWRTPEHVFAWLDLTFGPFEVDLAACEKSTKCDFYFCKEENSLAQDWSQFDAMFLNPPYDNITPWTEKSREIKPGSVLAVVLPNDNSTVWFRNMVEQAYTIINIVSNGKNSGRLAFEHAGTGKAGKQNNKGTVIFILRGRKRRAGVETLYIDQDQMLRDLGLLDDAQ
ncbi:DNA methyltransferase [Klebsiella phage EKq1]|nr:DNA methyltransferase [Klebsiella phage EKq1]